MSASKTQNYQLHAWAPGDDFLREEFNENFARLDGLYDTAVIMGTYTGDGAQTREIVLGFYPRAVLLMDKQGRTENNVILGGLALRGAPVQPQTNPPALKLTQQGFQVAVCGSGSYNSVTNGNNTIYYYIALR